jgi:hypothetical protein
VIVAAVHAFATLSMTGLIWFVQVVHYPLFGAVGEREFVGYAAAHVRRTTAVVAPLMLAEAATAAWLALRPPSPGAVWATTAGFLLLLVAWISTALLQVPCHRRLERGPDRAAVDRLVASNWIRTSAWTVRAVLAIVLLIGASASRLAASDRRLPSNVSAGMKTTEPAEPFSLPDHPFAADALAPAVSHASRAASTSRRW